MNSLDILLYTLGALAIAYVSWIILTVSWYGIIILYHRITDELHDHKLARIRKTRRNSR